MGKRLQNARLAAGMSQSRLAEEAGVPIGTLRNWEQDRRVPLLDTAARVAKALGMSLDELAGPVADASEAEPKHGRSPKAKPAVAASPEPLPAKSGKKSKKSDGEIKPLGVGLVLAHEALNFLTRIPKDDALRKRGFQVVTDWIRHNQ
jgi:transcriptional regulator with XRE-family HTH domain